MSVLVTAAEVKQIISTTLGDTIVDAYISDADEMLNQILSGDTTLSAGVKKAMEKWLTAHMIACTQTRMEVEAGAGGAYIKYANVYGENLKSTPYGQMVLTLDTTGNFAALGGRSARLIAVTTEYDE